MKRTLLFILIFLSFLLIFSAGWIEDNFGITSIDSILFVLRTPMTGVPGEMLLGYSGQVLTAAALALTLSGLLLYLLNDGPARLKKTLLFLPAAFFGASVIYVADEYQALRYINSEISYSTFMDDHYVRVEPDAVKPAKRPRNLVLLVLESMENTFYDRSLFKPALIPRLEAVQNSEVSFKRHVTGPGANWTVAGVTGYLMGIPLKLPLEENSYDGRYAGFLPGAASILEVLDAHGYAINLIMGSDSRFSGLNNLFASHCGNPAIYDRSWFAERSPDGGAGMSRWGPGDKEVYALAREVVGGLGRDKRPFFALIMSMDTHVPAKAFGDWPQPFGDARDGFVAADHMAVEFLSWLKRQRFYPNTAVVVIGDHPYMSKNLGAVEIPADYGRTVYNAFLNTGKKPRLGLRRQLYSFDVAPTLLEAMGFRLPGGRFGLGASLFGKAPTLLEKYGAEALDEGLRQRSKLYDGFFAEPDSRP